MSAVNDATLTIIMKFVDGDYSTTELVGDLQALGEAYENERATAVREAVLFIEKPAIERIRNLEAALEEARSRQFNLVQVKSYDLFAKAIELGKHDFIQYVKWVHNSGVLTVNGETGCELYVAKFVAEFVYAMYGMREFQVPLRGEELFVINTNSDRNDVARNIRLFLAHNFNGYIIDVSDPYGM